MKKLPGIILSILLCLPFLAIHTILTIKKQVIRREFKHEIIKTLSKSDLVLIALSKTEAEKQLNWEHDREFEYQGQMFDIVESELTPDSVKYWCWLDNDETHLNKMLEKLSSEASQDDKKRRANQLLTFLKSFHFIAKFELKTTIDIFSPLYSTEKPFLISHKSQPPSPPPEFVV
ncbi:MAG TPA: hypothetical protein PKL31_00410 [Fulvivirga sp.]|nr:hypothetical protein [Fulvivirga sp.]